MDAQISAAHNSETATLAKAQRRAAAAFDDFEADTKEATAAASFDGAAGRLTPLRKQWADKMFDTYDADGSGTLSLAEFIFLMRSQEPDLTEDEVRDSMAACGVQGSGDMSREAFYAWIDTVFASLDDQEFVETMEVMTETDASGMLKPARKAWADRLFTYFDEDASGSMDMDEFVKLMQVVAPEVTRTEVEATMLSAGASDGIMHKPQFYTWVNDVFGEFNDEDFESSMQSMIQAK